MVDVVGRPAGRTAAALRLATQDVHLQAEQQEFVVGLMSGRLGVGALARLTGQLRAVYAALEAAVPPHRSDPLLARLFDRRLDRVAAIDRDLAVLAGDHAGVLTDLLPATTEYVSRIEAVRDSAPRLVAEHYVRYLGDLSGGQIIASLMRRHYGLRDDALTFYAFDGLASKGGFKTEYRRLLDELFERDGAYDEVVDEARAAYAANTRLFVELGATGATGTSA